MLPLPKVLLLGICTLSSVVNWNLSLFAEIQWDGFNSLFFMNISWWEASLRCPLLQIYNFDYLFFFAFLLAYLWPKTKLDGISNYINCRFFPQKDVGHKALERLDGESWAKSQSSVLTLKVHSHCCCCCYDNYLSNDCLQGPLLTFLPQMSCFDTSGEKIWLTSCILKLTTLLLMATLRCFDFLGSQRQQSFSYCGDDLPARQKVFCFMSAKPIASLSSYGPNLEVRRLRPRRLYDIPKVLQEDDIRMLIPNWLSDLIPMSFMVLYAKAEVLCTLWWKRWGWGNRGTEDQHGLQSQKNTILNCWKVFCEILLHKSMDPRSEILKFLQRNDCSEELRAQRNSPRSRAE